MCIVKKWLGGEWGGLFFHDWLLKEEGVTLSSASSLMKGFSPVVRSYLDSYKIDAETGNIEVEGAEDQLGFEDMMESDMMDALGQSILDVDLSQMVADKEALDAGTNVKDDEEGKEAREELLQSERLYSQKQSRDAGGKDDQHAPAVDVGALHVDAPPQDKNGTTEGQERAPAQGDAGGGDGTNTRAAESANKSGGVDEGMALDLQSLHNDASQGLETGKGAVRDNTSAKGGACDGQGRGGDTMSVDDASGKDRDEMDRSDTDGDGSGMTHPDSGSEMDGETGRRGNDDEDDAKAREHLLNMEHLYEDPNDRKVGASGASVASGMSGASSVVASQKLTSSENIR